MDKILLALPLLLIAVTLAYGEHKDLSYQGLRPNCSMHENGTNYNQTCMTSHVTLLSSCIDEIHIWEHEYFRDTDNLAKELEMVFDVYIICDNKNKALTANVTTLTDQVQTLKNQLTILNASSILLSADNAQLKTDNAQLAKQYKDIYKENQQLRLRCQR